MNDDQKVCYCTGVTCGDIKKAMANGATTLDEIKKETGAATVCGRCAGTVEKILKGEE